MLPNNDFVAQWEHILADVNKTDVPLECIKKVLIKLTGGRQKTINLHTLLKQGMDLAEIESMLTRFLTDHEREIRDVDFVIDVASVAKLIQPETDKILSKL
jgi:hypothetical protein